MPRTEARPALFPPPPKKKKNFHLLDHASVMIHPNTHSHTFRVSKIGDHTTLQTLPNCLESLFSYFSLLPKPYCSNPSQIVFLSFFFPHEHIADKHVQYIPQYYRTFSVTHI